MGLTAYQKLEWLEKNDKEVYLAIEKIIDMAYERYCFLAEKNRIKTKKLG